MARRVAVFGVTEESLRLLPALSGHPDLVLTAVVDPDAASHRRRLALLAPDVGALLQRHLTDDLAALGADATDLVVDARPAGRPAPPLPAGLERIAVADALARFGGEAGSPEPPARELLQALEEVLQALELVEDPGRCAARLLDTALRATAADGGSILALEREDDVLRVRAARGLEPALWPEVRAPLGAGLAGAVAADLVPRAVRGAVEPALAGPRGPRPELAASLTLPLLGEDPPWGVLCLHHRTRSDAFAGWEGEPALRLGEALGRIAERADRRAVERDRAARLAAADAARSLLADGGSLESGLGSLCRALARDTEGGVATLWLTCEDGSLEAAAGSSGWPPIGRIEPGTGVEGRAASGRREVWLREDDGGPVRAAALPLLDGDRLVGVLSLQSAADLCLAPGGRTRWRAVARSAAREIARARRSERVAHRADRLAALQEVALDLLAEREPRRRAERTVAAACWLAGAEAAALRVRDERRRSYPVLAATGETGGDGADAEPRAARRALAEGHAAEGGPGGAGAQLLSVALARPGRSRPLGALTVWGPRAGERSGAGGFSDDDRDLLARLARFATAAWETRETDGAPPETGLRLSPAGLRRRLDEELERARASGEPLALLHFAVENFGELDADRAGPRALHALEAELRPFDRVAAAGRGAWWALLPAPGPAPAERLARLARAVSERVAKDEAGEPLRSTLIFGYAIHEGEEADRDAMFERASLPRIRML